MRNRLLSNDTYIKTYFAKEHNVLKPRNKARYTPNVRNVHPSMFSCYGLHFLMHTSTGWLLFAAEICSCYNTSYVPKNYVLIIA